MGKTLYNLSLAENGKAPKYQKVKYQILYCIFGQYQFGLELSYQANIFNNINIEKYFFHWFSVSSLLAKTIRVSEMAINSFSNPSLSNMHMNGVKCVFVILNEGI